MALRLRRGTDAERLLITPVEGELIYTTDTKLLYAGDGSTAGGILVTGSGGGGSTTLDALTDTNLTGTADSDVLTFNGATNKWEASPVPGVGTISLADLDDVAILENPVNGDALTFDGLNFVPKSLSDLFQEQQNYKINIVGDDSTIIVNTDTNEITGTLTGDVNGTDDQQLVDAAERVFRGDTIGFHVGDVVNVLENKLLVNATLETFTGDLTGSVFADDSTLVVDGLTGDLYANTIHSTSNRFTIGRDSGISELRLESYQTRNRLNINTVDREGDLSSYTGYYGTLNFGYEDSTTDRSDATIRGRNADMRMAHDTVSALIDDETKYFTLKEGNFGFGTYTPEVKMDVRGPIRPGVYADATARDAAITTPVAGMMVYLTSTNKHQGYNGTTWNDFY